MVCRAAKDQFVVGQKKISDPKNIHTLCNVAYIYATCSHRNSSNDMRIPSGAAGTDPPIGIGKGTMPPLYGERCLVGCAC